MEFSRYYFKLTVLGLLMLVESFMLSKSITALVSSREFFSISLDYTLQVTILMLICLYTFALTTGVRKKYEQYLIVSLPIALGIFLAVFTTSVAYATILFVLALLLCSYDIYRTNLVKDLLIKFDPKIIFRLSSVGVLFIFSVLGGTLVVLNASEVQKLNIGKEVSEILDEPLKKVVDSELEKNIENTTDPLKFGEISKEELQPFLKELGLADESQDTEIGKFSVKNIAEGQINAFLEPYRNLIHPVIAVLMFALFQFYATIVRIIFLVTVDLLFLVAKTSKFFSIEKSQVEKETLML